LWQRSSLGIGRRRRRLASSGGGIRRPRTERIDAGRIFDVLSALVDKNLVAYEDDGPPAAAIACWKRSASTPGIGSWRPARRRRRARGIATTSWPSRKRRRRNSRVPEQAAWYERLEIEHDNLRAALEWSLADPDGAEAGLRLVGALGRFWEVRGHIAEGRALATSMLTRPGAERRTPARAKALYAAGLLAALQYDFEVVTRHVDESLAIYQEAGDRAGEAALLMASSFRFFHADAATARANVERSLALRREMGDLPGVAECLIHLGDLAWSQGEAAAAQRLMEEALGLNRRLGNSYGVARTLRSLAEWAVDRDNYGEACPLLEAAAAIQKELRDRRKQADYLQLLANLAVAQGDVETARAAYEAGAALFRELDDDKNLAYMAMLPGHILLERGDAAGARARYEEGLALRRKFAPESTGWALLELGHAPGARGTSRRRNPVPPPRRPNSENVTTREACWRCWRAWRAWRRHRAVGSVPRVCGERRKGCAGAWTSR
jgi:tetratricopeptide (TPR) repeat protein